MNRENQSKFGANLGCLTMQAFEVGCESGGVMQGEGGEWGESVTPSTE